MAHRWLMVVLALLAGCGGLWERRGDDSARDPAIELAERLPRGLRRCVVARVGRVSGAERRFFAEVSLAGALGFSRGAPVSAVAIASERAGKEGPFVALLRTTEPPARVRRFFESSAGTRLSFAEELLCEDGLCQPVMIEFVEPTLLRIRRGVVAEQRSSGPSSPCGALLRVHPRAVEVAWWAADPVELGSRSSSPLESAWTVHARSGGLEVSRVERYADPRLALAAAQLQSVLPPEPGWTAAAEPLTRIAVGGELRFAAGLTYRDMVLNERDRENLRGAMAAEAEAASRLVPIDAIDLRRYAVVDRQVYLRKELLREAAGPETARLGREIVSLIGRALEVHPEHEGLAEVRFHILLEILADPEAAAEATEAALRNHSYDRAAWLARRREALVRFDVHGAAAALEEAEVVEGGRGREAAMDLRALLQASGAATDVPLTLGYPCAEAALVAVDRLVEAPAPVGLEEPLAVEWQALPETALALFELRGLAEPSDRLVVLVAGRSLPGAGALAPFVELSPRRGRGRRAAIVSTGGRAALRALGRALPAAVGEGRATLSFALVRAGGALARDRTPIVLAGRAGGDGLRLEAASGPTSDWKRAVRLLAGPLGRMHPSLRPGVEFQVEVVREEREVLLERLSATSEIECAETAHGLTCRSSLVGSALRRAWVEVAGRLLEPR